MSVPGHHRRDVDTLGACASVPGHDRPADTAVAFVADRDDASRERRSAVGDRPGGYRGVGYRAVGVGVSVDQGGVTLDLCPCVARRAVVDDVDTIDERRDGLDDPTDEPLLIVRRNDDADRAVLVYSNSPARPNGPVPDSRARPPTRPNRDRSGTHARGSVGSESGARRPADYYYFGHSKSYKQTDH